jgi:predicted ATPase/transcriptional regulator with XRE-family HTH domain
MPNQPAKTPPKYQPSELFLMYRKRSGWTQEGLAKKIGLESSRAVRNWEVGQSLPKAERLKKLIETYMAEGIFLKQKEKEEVVQLWNSVKASFDLTTQKYDLYPVFDEGWFDNIKNADTFLAKLEILPFEEDETTPSNPLVPIHNLPLQLTSFIGREKEVAEIKHLLKTSRLLTITGMGGMGKTRLLLQVGSEVIGEYPDGVWLVELAPLNDSSLVIESVAHTLGLGEDANNPLLQVLANYLLDKNILLLLDNCEHVAQGCVELIDYLLRFCSNVKFLTSSREVLNVDGEVTWNVSNLSLPVSIVSTNLSTFLSYEAVELFVERAGAANPKFSLNNQNVVTIINICQKLEGIPLAIELAAARVKVLSVEEIYQRLDDRFKLLTGGSRNLLPRHQTLRAMIDWSYEMLSVGEQVLLQRLTVFASSWTLAGAEAVCADDSYLANPENSPVQPLLVTANDVLDLLSQLVNKSLVILLEPEVAGSGEEIETRYRFLDVIRQYGREKLLARTEPKFMQDRHLAYFSLLTQQLDLQPGGIEQNGGLERLDREFENLLMALEWSTTDITLAQAYRVLDGLKMVNSLLEYWTMRGYFTQGRERADNLLAAAKLVGLEDTAEYARGIYTVGQLSWRLGNFRVALLLLEESLALFEDSDQKERIAWAWLSLGILQANHKDFEGIRAYFEQSLALFQNLDNRRGEGYALMAMGNLYLLRHSFNIARRYFEKAMEIFNLCGDRRGKAKVLPSLGNLALYQNDFSTAASLFQESLALSRKLGDRGEIAYTLHEIGNIYLLQDKLEPAEKYYRESLEVCIELDDKRGITVNLGGLANTLQGGNEPEQLLWSGRLCGAVAALLSVTGSTFDFIDQQIFDRSLEILQAKLSEELLEQTLKEGESMTVEQLVDYILKK